MLQKLWTSVLLFIVENKRI